ncbi:hypothetical protein V8D89_004355 [Ganoderma adspersum]
MQTRENLSADRPSATAQHAGGAGGVGDGPTQQPREDDPRLQLKTITQQTRETISNLTQSIACIRKQFRSVSDVLLEFDRGEYVDKKGAVLKLRPTWEQYIVRFENIIKVSKDTAIAASSMMKQYKVVLLQVAAPSVDPDQLAALKTKIQKFLSKLEQKVQVADKMESDMVTLAEDIRQFGQTDLESAGDKIRSKFAEDLKCIQDEMSNLDNRLERISESVSDYKAQLCWARGAGLAAGIASGGIILLSLLGFFLPPLLTISAGIIISGGIIGAGGYARYNRKELERMEKEKSEIEKKKDETSTREGQVKARQKAFENFNFNGTKKEVASVADKIATIGSVWKYLRADMRQLVEDLDNAVGPTMDVDGLSCIPSLELSREVYDTLAEFLSLYARA